MFDPKKPTGLLMGRYQPWHAGHRALFDTVLSKVGQVCIAVRDTHGTSVKDPLDFETVRQHIIDDLEPACHGTYVIVQVPNITGIYYGRDVGYSIEQLHMGAEIEAISATQVRKERGL